MDQLIVTKIPVTQVGMVIRRPVEEVYEAFVDPAITTQFWFTKSSGRLEEGRELEWAWEMYGVSTSLMVKVLEPNRRIVIGWPGLGGMNTVEWTFRPQADGSTYVEIVESGYGGTGDELVATVADSTQGFSFVLAGLKAYLEHGIRLNLVADKAPADAGEF